MFWWESSLWLLQAPWTNWTADSYIGGRIIVCLALPCKDPWDLSVLEICSLWLLAKQRELLKILSSESHFEFCHPDRVSGSACLNAKSVENWVSGPTSVSRTSADLEAFSRPWNNCLIPSPERCCTCSGFGVDYSEMCWKIPLVRDILRSVSIGVWKATAERMRTLYCFPYCRAQNRTHPDRTWLEAKAWNFWLKETSKLRSIFLDRSTRGARCWGCKTFVVLTLVSAWWSRWQSSDLIWNKKWEVWSFVRVVWEILKLFFRSCFNMLTGFNYVITLGSGHGTNLWPSEGKSWWMTLCVWPRIGLRRTETLLPGRITELQRNTKKLWLAWWYLTNSKWKVKIGDLA